MSTSGGPNIVTDGLVFGYDTGYPATENNQSLRFNNGEPTVNLITNPLPTSTTGFNRSGGTGTISYDSTEKALKWVQTDYSSWGTYLNIHPSFTGTLSTSTQYTLSFEYKTLNAFGDNLISHNLVQGNGQSAAASTGAISNNTSGEINGWKQFSVTFTPSNTGVGTAYNRVITGDRGSDTLTMYIKNIQFEQKSHQTPFVNGTRSSTGALIDLKETTDIDLTNVSFDSNAQLTFDGTDDGINLSDNEIFDFTDGVATIEAIVKFPSSWTGGSQYPNLISKGGSAGWDSDGWALYGFRDWPSSGQKSWGFAMRNSGTVRNTSRNNITVDEYLHIVATIDGTTIRLYENGVQVNTNTQTINPASNSTNVYIGRGPSSQFFPGELPIAKVYSSTLSAAEIKQNYNAYKKRFGI